MQFDCENQSSIWTGWFTFSQFPSELGIVKSFDETGEDHLFFNGRLSSINSPSKCSHITKKRGNCLVWLLLSSFKFCFKNFNICGIRGTKSCYQLIKVLLLCYGECCIEVQSISFEPKCKIEWSIISSGRLPSKTCCCCYEWLQVMFKKSFAGENIWH